MLSTLNVRRASESYYLPANPGLASGTLRKLRHQWNRWEKSTDDPPITRIGPTTFAAFRAACLADQLSPTTIEGVVSDVLTVLGTCADVGALSSLPRAGKRLRKMNRPNPTPTLDELSAMLKAASCAQWPRSSAVPSRDWWTLCLAAAFFTALRLQDLLNRPLAEFRAETLEITQSKTGKVLRIPVHPVLRKLSKKFPLAKLGGGASLKQLRRELRRICETAGVRNYTIQSLRRLSGREWERARPGCGSLILGHSIMGASRFYLDPYPMLQDAMPLLQFPAALGRQPIQRDESRLLRAFRRLDAREAARVVRLVEGFGE